MRDYTGSPRRHKLKQNKKEKNMKDYINEWKKESGIRLWKDFWREEYTPKYKAFADVCENMATLCGFKDKPNLCLGKDGFSMLISGGGPGWFTWRKLSFAPAVSDLVRDFEKCHHEAINFDFADQLQRLQHDWTSKGIAL